MVSFIKRGGSQRILQRLRGNPRSQLSACPLCCYPLPEPLPQTLLWECCREAAQTHLAKWCWEHTSAVGMMLGSWAEEDSENKGEGWMLQPTMWHLARATYPLPSRACAGRPPWDFGGKQMGCYPKVINDSLASFAVMTSRALHKHQRKPCPENSHPEKANKRGNHRKPCTKQLRWLQRYGTQTRMSWSARVMSALLLLGSAKPSRRHPTTTMITHCGDKQTGTNQESCFPQCLHQVLLPQGRQNSRLS